MATTYKVLGQLAPASTSQIYTQYLLQLKQ
jgi:hypothetical protein